jgi:hypothetical protein
LIRNRDWEDSSSVPSNSEGGEGESEVVGASPVSNRDWFTSSGDGAGFQYEELMGGSIPCPSCMGSGRIPKEREGQLVALIPVNDKRLKPRRTCLWVSIGVGLSIVTSALLLFFLIPRSLTLTGNKHPIVQASVLQHKKGQLMLLNFKSYVNVSNGNFYTVRAVNASVSVINRWNTVNPSIVIGHGFNKTGLSIPLRHDNSMLDLNVTTKITDRWMLYFCESEFGYWVPMQLDVTVTFEYMNHREQDTVSTTQQVCCRANNANCTLETSKDSNIASLRPVILDAPLLSDN